MVATSAHAPKTTGWPFRARRCNCGELLEPFGCPVDPSRPRGLQHIPRRPDWTCDADGDPWPCRGHKVALLIEYAGSRLALAEYLAMHLSDACADQPDRAAEMYAQILGWVRIAAHT